MTARYTASFALRYQDTDSSLRITPMSLMGLMQETAILHSEAVGRGFSWLAQRQAVWMIVQTRAQIQRLPAWPSQISINTWPSDMGRLLSRREFIATDENGPWARVTTLWAYVNTSRRRVCRVPQEMLEAYPVDEERAIAGSFPRPSPCQEPQVCQERPIRSSDMDSNGHVNNLRYLIWILDSLPENLSARRTLTELNIRYQKELLPGGRIEARCQQLADDGQYKRFAHEIRPTDGGQRIALAETRWLLEQS